MISHVAEGLGHFHTQQHKNSCCGGARTPNTRRAVHQNIVAVTDFVGHKFHKLESAIKWGVGEIGDGEPEARRAHIVSVPCDVRVVAVL